MSLKVSLPGHSKLRPRRIDGAHIGEELNALGSELDSEGEFDPFDETDAREKTLGAIVRRQGQAAFRQSMLKAYAGKCALTGCNVEQVLEAAHIRPYLGAHTNVATNGLLLRADIHTLFDLGLVRVCSETLQVHLSNMLNGSQYQAIAGRRIELPGDPAARPSKAAIRLHWESSAANF